MISSIVEFEKLAFEAIAQLSFEQKCAYCYWCLNRLYSSYSFLLQKKLTPKQLELTRACYNQVKKIVDDADLFIDTRYKDQHSMQRTDLEFMLNYQDSEDHAVLKLTEAIDNTLRFIATKNSDLVMLMPVLSVEIIDTILANEYGLDTSDIDRVIDNRLLQSEFKMHLNVIDTLSRRATG